MGHNYTMDNGEIIEVPDGPFEAVGKTGIRLTARATMALSDPNPARVKDTIPIFVDVCRKCYRSVVVIEATGFLHKESHCEHGTEFVVRYWPKDE